MAVEGGRIEIHAPNIFKAIQCLIQNNIGSGSPPIKVVVLTATIKSSSSSLYDLVIQSYPHLETGGFDFQSTQLAGYSALKYSQLDNVYGETNQYIFLRSPNGNTLITIVGPEGGSELKRALSTFQFE